MEKGWRVRGQVSRKIMADSREWGYEERQADGNKWAEQKDVNVGKEVVPSRGEYSIPLVAEGYRVARKRPESVFPMQHGNSFFLHY